MEYANHLNDYAPAPTSDEVAQAVSAAMQATGKNCTTEVYRFLLSAIDLTTLSCTDSEQSVAAMARRAAEFDIDYPHLQNVASICVYPPFVETAGLEIDGTSLKITAVAGGFPSSQTFLEVKMLEVAMAIENGADEVDVVLNAGKILSGAYDEAANEILEQVFEILGRFLAAISCVADPEVIVLGGGVSKAGQPLIDGATKYFHKYAFHACRSTRITLATLGNDAGAYGAFKLALDEFAV